MARIAINCTLTEAELVQLLTAGREDAFTEIYNRYWERLLAIAYNLTKDKVIAEEITQEVFISLWKRRKEVHIETLGGYLATAVKFSIFKHIVRQKRRKEILKDAPLHIDNEEERIYTLFLKEYIQGIVDQLPEKCRLVFRYSRQEGMTLAEIADKLNISPKTAEAHLTKALKTIRLNLKLLIPFFFTLH